MRLNEMTDNPPARHKEPEAKLPRLGRARGKPPLDSTKWKSTREQGGYEVWNSNDEPVSGTTWFTRVAAERERHSLGDGTLKIVSIHYVSDKETF